MNIIDTNIIKKLKAGEEYAFRYIYEKHYVALCIVAKQFVHDDFLAESIVEDVIFNLWEKRTELDIQTSLRGYLTRAVKNRSLNYLKERQVRDTQFFANLHDFSIQHNTKESPIVRIIEKEMESKIAASIRTLHPECRKVFELCRFKKMKYDEIAEALGISVNTVKYHMKNAINKLKIELREFL